jgi:ketosteroid isomerase-like protein
MSPARMAQVESSIRTVLEFHEAFNRHDAAGMLRLLSDDTIFENTSPAPDGTVFRGKPAVGQFWEEFFRQSPRAHIEVEEIYSLGPRCVMRWKYTWEDADGVKGHVRGVDLFQVKNGLISEKFSYVKG